jgi:hypothetical protein
MQLLTKSGKPVIHKDTKLPVYSKPIDIRLKILKKQLLSHDSNSHEQYNKNDITWRLIQQQVSCLGL